MGDPVPPMLLAVSAFVGSILAEIAPFAHKYLAADEPGRDALRGQYLEWTYLPVRLAVAVCVAFMATMGATPTQVSAFVLGLAGLNASEFFTQRKDFPQPPAGGPLPPTVSSFVRNKGKQGPPRLIGS